MNSARPHALRVAAVDGGSCNRSVLNFTDSYADDLRLNCGAHRSPILTTATLNRMLGRHMLMEAENFQRIVALEFRCGYDAINGQSAKTVSRSVTRITNSILTVTTLF